MSVPTGDESLGNGIGIRLGPSLSSAAFAVTPEASVEGYNFGNERIRALLAGARIGFGAGLRPGVMAHGGIAWYSLGSVDARAFQYDLGALLDFTLVPFMDVGAHAKYHAFAADSPQRVTWLSFGLHADLVF